jgi:HPt (histidine-containing phosphotransfer) domain-containing protein
MNDFLAKPFSYEEITAKVTQWRRLQSQQPSKNRGLDQNTQAGPTDINEAERPPDSGSEAELAVASVLDPQALDQLRSKQKYRKKDLVRRVVCLYLEQAPKLLQEMAIAKRESDTEALVHLAHTLKSSSLTVGATALAHSCREIEEMGERGCVIDDIIEKLPQQYIAVEKDLRSVLSDEV